MEAKIYNQKGKEAGVIELPKKIFGSKWRSDLVHQVVYGMLGNARSSTAHTKDRGEVRGGGKKPWKQKGTGRARHGSSRSPIWVGGGVTHGPLKEKSYKRKISKKMRKEALFSILSKKQSKNEIVFVDSLSFSEMKTKTGKEIIKNIALASNIQKAVEFKKPKILIALFEKNEKTQKSLKNLPFLNMTLVKNLNPVDLLNYKYLLIENPTQSIKFLESKNL
jgi:large subunit ribosomal protein L4